MKFHTDVLRGMAFHNMSSSLTLSDLERKKWRSLIILSPFIAKLHPIGSWLLLNVNRKLYVFQNKWSHLTLTDLEGQKNLLLLT